MGEGGTTACKGCQHKELEEGKHKGGGGSNGLLHPKDVNSRVGEHPRWKLTCSGEIKLQIEDLCDN